MTWAETRLELFTQVIVMEMSMNAHLHATTFSRIFERNGRLEIGQRLLKLLGSEPGFLSIGVTAADLRDDGTEPEVRE